jgi:hypothetical protein
MNSTTILVILNLFTLLFAIIALGNALETRADLEEQKRMNGWGRRA